MTSTSWTNLSYYGLKIKKDFTLCDTLIKKSKDVENPDDIQIDTLLKMMKHKTTIATTLTKMMAEMDTTNRIENIERLIQAVSPEALAEARKALAT